MKGLLLLAAACLLTLPASANTHMNGLNALLSPNDTVLLLIDHQPFQFADLHSHDPLLVQNNVIALAKTAKLFNIPVVITSVLEARGGFFLKGVLDVFPDITPIDRTWINTWQDSRVVEAIAKTGRKKIIMAALWTEVCLAMPVISALADGYDVYFVTDASGGKSLESHDMAVIRMAQAGAVPITWMAVLCELQRDWSRSTQAGVLDIFKQHGGGSGIAYLWETQLMNPTTSATSTGVSSVTSTTGVRSVTSSTGGTA